MIWAVDKTREGQKGTSFPKELKTLFLEIIKEVDENPFCKKINSKMEIVANF